MHVDTTTLQEITDTITTALHHSVDECEGCNNITLYDVWSSLCRYLRISSNLDSNKYLRDSIIEWARYVDLPTDRPDAPQYTFGYSINSNDERMMSYLKYELSTHLVKTVLRDLSRL